MGQMITREEIDAVLRDRKRGAVMRAQMDKVFAAGSYIPDDPADEPIYREAQRCSLRKAALLPWKRERCHRELAGREGLRVFQHGANEEAVLEVLAEDYSVALLTDWLNAVHRYERGCEYEDDPTLRDQVDGLVRFAELARELTAVTE